MGSNDTMTSIELPITEYTFKNISNAKRLVMDIGGSLVKIAYCSSYRCQRASFSESDTDEIYSLRASSIEIPTLNFMKFETKYIELALDHLEQSLNLSKEENEDKTIKVTGGGSYKYKDLIKRKLGINVEREDEMQCLIKGCNFLTKNVPNEVFTINFETMKHEFKVIDEAHLYPYILVNIGSGVSILKVDSNEHFQRIGGSTIGGATLWGLGSLLTDANGFDEILHLAEKGDNRSIDMLVKDIYGGGYEKLGLPEDIIASSFGKATRSSLDFGCTREELLEKYEKKDILKSILLMICYDVSQIASLYARIHNVNKVFFGGYFIHGSEITMKYLKHGVSFWSQDKIECLFLRHEGYLGAIGAFLKTDEESDQTKYSWYENLARSTGYVRPRSDSASFDQFELNQEDIKLVPCPLLLEPFEYVPDLFDLTKDEEARNYWLDCFEKTIHTYEKQCIKSQIIEKDCKKRAEEFKISYMNKISHLKTSPFSYGMLTVRSLLELREHCMSDFNFFDVYSIEKREENRLGLELLAERCSSLEKITDIPNRWYHLFKGVLAGNVYDYGAQAFIERQSKGSLDDFNKALEIIDDTLWSEKCFLDILENLKEIQYKCIAIFVDNSGFDIVLGILPIVIEFLKDEKIKVMLCTNSKPAINDITYPELLILIRKACTFIPALNEAFYNTKRLLIFETGSSSPCLDLSRINVELTKKMIEFGVDLIILEGMGRAIHTNYDTKFKCDCLKIAVIKNNWLANRFNLLKENEKNKFPIVFKFEKYLE